MSKTPAKPSPPSAAEAEQPVTPGDNDVWTSPSPAVVDVAPVDAEPAATQRTQDRPTDPASRAAWKRARGIALGEPHSQ